MAQTALNVGMILRCAYRKKTRLIYSQRKLSADEARIRKRLLNNFQYICRTVLQEMINIFVVLVTRDDQYICRTVLQEMINIFVVLCYKR